MLGQIGRASRNNKMAHAWLYATGSWARGKNHQITKITWGDGIIADLFKTTKNWPVQLLANLLNKIKTAKTHQQAGKMEQLRTSIKKGEARHNAQTTAPYARYK